MTRREVLYGAGTGVAALFLDACGGGSGAATASASAPTITTASSLPNGAAGAAYRHTMAATGGAAPYSWSLVGATGANTWAVTSAGVVTGTPGSAETDTLTIKLTDFASNTAQGPFSVIVVGSGVVNPVANGQQIAISNTGRAGAAAAGIANYSAARTTISGARTYSTDQVIRNVLFTGPVLVTSGNVVFEFCSFTYQPPTAAGSPQSSALLHYENGNPLGTLTCNWCDFDSGLRGASAGHFETCGFQAGQRAVVNPATQVGSFLLYRCRIQGYGNNIGVHRYNASAMSYVRECCLDQQTGGDGTHMDGVEIYSSSNITVERCRIVISFRSARESGQSAINITTDFGLSNGNPIVIQNNYINGGISPVLTRWYNAGGGNVGMHIKNVRFVGNYFGDGSIYGRECDFNAMNVTLDPNYQATIDPTAIYWSRDNIWAPNGEGVMNPATSPSGDVPAGLPHSPGTFISTANFYGGEAGAWNGKVAP